MDTLGEFRVRTNFNPSTENSVDMAKQTFANLINQVDSFETKNLIDSPNPIEQMRLAEIVHEKLEDACMWMIKLLTMPSFKSDFSERVDFIDFNDNSIVEEIVNKK